MFSAFFIQLATIVINLLFLDMFFVIRKAAYQTKDKLTDCSRILHKIMSHIVDAYIVLTPFCNNILSFLLE